MIPCHERLPQYAPSAQAAIATCCFLENKDLALLRVKLLLVALFVVVAVVVLAVISGDVAFLFLYNGFAERGCLFVVVVAVDDVVCLFF